MAGLSHFSINPRSLSNIAIHTFSQVACATTLYSEDEACGQHPNLPEMRGCSLQVSLKSALEKFTSWAFIAPTQCIECVCLAISQGIDLGRYAKKYCPSTSQATRRRVNLSHTLWALGRSPHRVSESQYVQNKVGKLLGLRLLSHSSMGTTLWPTYHQNSLIFSGT